METGFAARIMRLSTSGARQAAGDVVGDSQLVPEQPQHARCEAMVLT